MSDDYCGLPIDPAGTKCTKAHPCGICETKHLRRIATELLQIVEGLEVSYEAYGCHLGTCKAVTDYFSDDCTCGWEDATFIADEDETVIEARRMLPHSCE